MVNYIHLDPNPLRTFNILYAVFTLSRQLRNAELVHKEEALYLRLFTQELKMRKFAISCCVKLITQAAAG